MAQDRLPMQDTEAHTIAYAYKGSSLESSSTDVIHEAAKGLLFRFKTPRSNIQITSAAGILHEQESNLFDPTLPVLFICWGLAGLVVKEVC